MRPASPLVQANDRGHAAAVVVVAGAL